MRGLIAVLIALTLCACSATAIVQSEVDHSYSMSKVDPVWITLNDKPTIDERNLIGKVSAEALREGFTVASAPEQAKWVLVVGHNRSTEQIGSTSRRRPFGRSEERFDYQTSSTLSLSAYQANSNTLAWSCTVSSRIDMYQERLPGLIELSLAHYGSDFEDEQYVRRNPK